MINYSKVQACKFYNFLQHEIEKALAAGIPADKVMYAFVYKSEEDMKKASKLGITLMVTNCVEQIEAISKYIPNARYISRMKYFHCDI